ncbi:MAG TPA: hypothetical protein PL028_02080 [Bacteroidales bacterium]|nr:hypothetical protein [Bacteroidales bacterium]
MSNSNDSEINNNLEPEKNQENDPKLSRRDALKRAAKQTLGLAGLFAALPALSSIAPVLCERHPKSKLFSNYV